MNLKDARVEVKTALPKGGISKLKGLLFVNWSMTGEAVFHKECWEQLLYAAQRRKRKVAKTNALETNGHILVQLDCEKKMIKMANETVEMFDAEEKVVQAAITVAEHIRSAKHCMIFTGAGISTSAGLGDFRGKGGKWTEQERETVNIQVPLTALEDLCNEDLSSPKRMKLPYNLRGDHQQTTSDTHNSKTEEKEEKDSGEDEDVAYEALRPTYTHEAIQHLIEAGHVKYLVSQNCDGLHILSGVPSHKISELHGNVFVECCEKCSARYQRSFYVGDDVADIYLEELEDYGKTSVIPPKHMKKCDKCGLSHRTGRKCEKQDCNGFLNDTIINFCDDLEDDILDKAFEAAFKCDLMICLGTTLTVTPASHIVGVIKRPQRVIICNRQATEKDDACMKTDKQGNQLGVRVYADCDVLMKHIMANLLGEQVTEFEEGLPSKRLQYDRQRSNSHS